MQSQLSTLESHKKTFATTNDPVPETFTPSHDEIYDPSHPDADWAGLVKKTAYTRKHERDHVSQRTCIMHTAEGIVSKQERHEFPRKKKDYDTNVTQGTPNLIAGVLPPNHEPYLTDMRRLELGVKTDREQLILTKQQPPRKNMNAPNQNSLIAYEN